MVEPTPTAEPCKRCGGARFIDTGRTSGNYSVGTPCPSCNAEPTRIEDMAPGTTFTARVALPGAVDDRFTVMDGPTNVWLRGEQYEVTVPDRIDPSTIRDVTPPKEA